MSFIISGLRELDYKCYLVDIWGVLHNGGEIFPQSLQCLKDLKAAGKQVCLFSNAPRRTEMARKQLEQKGLDARLYHGIITSGAICYDALKKGNHPYAKGSKALHLGEERDQLILDSTPYDITENVDEADFIVCTNYVNDYPAILSKAVAKGLKMICVNPDMYVYAGVDKVRCSGFVAIEYKNLGGDVYYHGKPYPDIYENAISSLGVEKSKVAAIGDSLHTDIQGACRAGIDSILIYGSGLYKLNKENPTPEDFMISERPNYLLNNLKW